MPLTDQEIRERVDIADRYMKRFRDADILASSRYIDTNSPAVGADDDYEIEDIVWDEADTPDDVPVGQINYETINSEIRLAAITMNDPELLVKAYEKEGQSDHFYPGASGIVSKSWDQAWRRGDWKWEAQQGFQKFGICGLGMAWFRWDVDYGPCFEHVASKRLLLDPNATSLKRLEYGGVKVRMSLRKAQRLYDGIKYQTGDAEGEEAKTFKTLLEEGDKNADKTVVTIVVYFDLEEEVHLYNRQIVYRAPNLYKRVPFLPVKNFIDPRDRLLPLGDNIYAAGLNQSLVDLTSIASNTAKHGGPINLYSSSLLRDRERAALEQGQQQGWIPVKGGINPQSVPIHRIPAEELSPAYGEARDDAQDALDAIMGVTGPQRGQAEKDTSATAAHMAAMRGGAKPIDIQTRYEEWIGEWAEAYVWMMQEFGGPQEGVEQSQKKTEVWKAFKAVYEVSVVQGSTAFFDPANSQQASLQLYTAASQSFPMWQGLAAKKIVDKVPNLEALYNNLLRAFAVSSTDEYWTQAPPPPPPQYDMPVHLVRALQTIYKDAPDATKRIIEQALGLPQRQPEQPEADHSGEDAVIGKAMDQQHDLTMQQRDHVQEMRLATLNHIGDLVKQASAPRPEPAAKNGQPHTSLSASQKKKRKKKPE